MHILKSNPVLRELEHVQVDGPGIAYLFFYNKQGCWGLGQDAADAVQTHMEEAFSEWISHSAHFTISLFPLMEAWQRSVAASDHQRLRGQAENPVHNMPVVATRESDSLSQLVGGASPLWGGRSDRGKAHHLYGGSTTTWKATEDPVHYSWWREFTPSSPDWGGTRL